MTIPATSPERFDSLSLSKLFHAAGILAGSTKGSVAVKASEIGKEAQLVDLLRARVASAESVLPQSWLHSQYFIALDASSSETLVKLATAKLALFILVALQSEEDKEKVRHAPASKDEVPPAPVFGSRDITTIQTLASLVAKWGLATLVHEGTLPASMLDRPARAPVRIAEVDEDLEYIRPNALDQMMDQCAALLLPPPTPERREIQAIALPLLLVPLLAALLQLSHIRASAGESEQRFQQLLALYVTASAC